MTFSCDANGSPVPTFSWETDGSTVDTYDNYRITLSPDEKQLTIMYVEKTDSGQYQCVASNSLGSATSNAATLDVKCKYITREIAIRVLHLRWYRHTVLCLAV